MLVWVLNSLCFFKTIQTFYFFKVLHIIRFLKSVNSLNSNLAHKLHIFEITILNTEWKDRKCRKNLCAKNFTYTKKFYVQEIATKNIGESPHYINSRPLKRHFQHFQASNYIFWAV